MPLCPLLFKAETIPHGTPSFSIKRALICAGLVAEKIGKHFTLAIYFPEIMTQLLKIILNPCRMIHASRHRQKKKADKANEATVRNRCQGNHLRYLSPSCHTSEAPVHEHYVLIALLHDPALNKSRGLSWLSGFCFLESWTLLIGFCLLSSFFLFFFLNEAL